MITLNIKLDYKVHIPKDMGEEERAKMPKPQELTIEYISQAVSQKYDSKEGGKGMEGQLRRMWGRVQRKFDAAIEADASTVDLETAEIDLIKKSFAEAKFRSLIAKYVQVLEDELDSIKE